MEYVKEKENWIWRQFEEIVLYRYICAMNVHTSHCADTDVTLIESITKKAFM